MTDFKTPGAELPITFAIADVQGKVRHELAKHFAERPAMGECPENLRVPVTLTGYLDYVWGSDDGTSIEFAMHVDKAVVGS